MNKWNPYKNELCHYGVKGQQRGVRQYQNPDGTWTELGKMRRRIGSARFKNTDDILSAREGFANGIDNTNDTYGKGNKKYMDKKPFWEVQAYNSSPYYKKDIENMQIAQNIMSTEWNGIKTDIPKKKKPSSICDDIENANPNRAAGLYDENNCSLCALAYCARRSGLDAQASYAPFGTQRQAYEAWLKDFELNDRDIVRMNKKTVKQGLFKKPKTPSEVIEDHIRENSEPGTFGILGISVLSISHAMTYEHLEDGRVIMLNPQDKTLAPCGFIDSVGAVAFDRDENFVFYNKPVNAKSFTKEAFETTGKPGKYGYAIEPYRNPKRKQ